MFTVITKIIDVNGDNANAPVKYEAAESEALKQATRVTSEVTPIGTSKAVLTLIVED